jgi:peptidoglycan/xylan/chitin deacetylase (PgdA/CDA1 family)
LLTRSPKTQPAQHSRPEPPDLAASADERSRATRRAERRQCPRAFVTAGGTTRDHTVYHPDLTTLRLGQPRAQWAQARQALGRWLGHAPVLGRPPYGAFDRTVEVAAVRAGLRALAGWSATVSGDRVQT